MPTSDNEKKKNIKGNKPTEIFQCFQCLWTDDVPLYIGFSSNFVEMNGQLLYLNVSIDPNESRDFHPAVLLIWWTR